MAGLMMEKKLDMCQRAISVLSVKAVDSGRRRFSGVATTPATDRMGDEINPLGVQFTNPVVLLRGHDHDEPIGRVTLKRPTAKGIEFDAEIPVPLEEGKFKDRVDEAWHEIAYGVVRAVSIGFRPLKYSFKDNGGIIFDEIEVYELSTVSVPALPEAVISSIKSLEGGVLPANIAAMIGGSSPKSFIKLIDHKTVPFDGIRLKKS